MSYPMPQYRASLYYARKAAAYLDSKIGRWQRQYKVRSETATEGEITRLIQGLGFTFVERDETVYDDAGDDWDGKVESVTLEFMKLRPWKYDDVTITVWAIWLAPEPFETVSGWSIYFNHTAKPRFGRTIEL